MQVIFLIIILCIGCLIIRKKGIDRFYLYLFGVIFIPSVIPLPFNGLPAHRFFAICFIVSILWHDRKNFKSHIPLLFISILLLISHFFTGYFDDRLSSYSKFWKPLINFINTFFLLYLGYFTIITTCVEWKVFCRKMSNVLIVVCLYGIMTFILRVDPYAELILKIFNINSDFTPIYSGDRIRTCSFLFNSHIFAYFCSVWILFYIYFSFKRKLFNKEKITFLLLICCLIISGSRSSLLSVALGGLFFIFFAVNISKTVRYVLIVSVLFIPLSQTTLVQEKLSFITDIFKDDGGKTSGSNISMREQQLEISLMLYSRNPIWGNGFDYFGEVLSTNHDESNSDLKGLLGAESYYFILLIERGLVQIVLIVLFFMQLTLFLLKRKTINPLEYSLGLSLLLAFIFVSLITGNTSKWEYIFPLLGLLLCFPNIKYISTYEKN